MRQQATLIDPGQDTTAIAKIDPGLTPGRFALLFALLIFAAFPQVILGLQTFVVRDFGFFAYPLAHYQRECFWRGEMPLWNPFNHCGVPFLAQWNTMPLYPPALIYLLLPLSWSLGFFCLLHLLWAGLGMYFLTRRWTGSLLGASVAGLIFGFNGFSLNLLMWPSHIATLSWMPWVVLAAERGWREGGSKLGVAALVGLLQMLAGGPETIFLTWTICAALWATDLLATRRESAASGSLHLLWRFPATVVMVTFLAAVQLLPFIDLAAHSQRETGFADARWSMPAWGWANFLVPMVFGNTMKQGLFFQHEQYWTSSYYVGIGTLVLAAVGLRSARNARVWVLGAFALLGLLLATGDETFISRSARQVIPQLSLVTYPVKFVLLPVFALPLLAGFGIEWLQNTSRPSARTRLFFAAGVVLLVLGGVLFWAWRFPMANAQTGVVLLNGLTRVGFLLGAVALLVALLPGAFQRSPRFLKSQYLVPVMLLVLCWLDIVTHEPWQNPVVPTWVYEPALARKELALNPQPSLGKSRVMLSPVADKGFRRVVLDDPKDNFLVKRLGLFADCNLLDAVPKVDGFFSLCPRECGELHSALYVSGAVSGEGLPDFLSVSHVSGEGDVKWVARDTFLPLATGGQSPIFLDDTNAVRMLLSPGFDPRKTVVLPPEAGKLVSTNLGSARVSIKSVRAERVDLEVEAAGQALVVIGQTWYHHWRAYMDNKPANLLRANYAFQAVQVGPGTHHLQLRYEDRMFRAGALVSSVTLAGCLGLAFYPGLRRRRRFGRQIDAVSELPGR